VRRALPIALIFVGCVTHNEESPEYERAETALHQTLADTVDPTFGDPRFVEVRRLFEQVPKDGRDFEKAQAFIRAIDEGQAKREKYETDRARREAEDKAKVDAALEGVRRSLREDSPAPPQDTGGAAFDTQSGGTYSYSGTTDEEKSARKQVTDRLDRAIVEKPAPAPEPRPVIDPALTEHQCMESRNSCLERCAWVVDPNLKKSAGFGSPAHMRCVQQCPKCPGDVAGE